MWWSGSMGGKQFAVFPALISLMGTEAGGRVGYILSGYRPRFRMNEMESECEIRLVDDEKLHPGESGRVEVKLLWPDCVNGQLVKGACFELQEGWRTVV